jgi:hypothetical protein
LGDADPNKGVGKIDLLGVGPEDRLVVVKLKFAAPGATRGGTGDTPLRALLDGLALGAIASANREPLASELAAAVGRTLSDQPPVLALIATPRYWELCRKREAQKGAAWINEMERLAREVEEWIGVQVLYRAVSLQGDPGWEYGEEGPVLAVAPELASAWEARAGVVRPKVASRPKAQAASAETIVEADLSRPIRAYLLTESYRAGDRIFHPTLGTGVVQSSAGVGKVRVLFDGKKALLVHQRPGPGPSSDLVRLAPASERHLEGADRLAEAGIVETALQQRGLHGARGHRVQSHPGTAPLACPAPQGPPDGVLGACIGEEGLARFLQDSVGTGLVVSEQGRRVGVVVERDELGRVRADHHGGRILAPLECGKQPVEQLDSAKVVDRGDQRNGRDVDPEPRGEDEPVQPAVAVRRHCGEGGVASPPGGEIDHHLRIAHIDPDDPVALSLQT